MLVLFIQITENVQRKFYNRRKRKWKISGPLNLGMGVRSQSSWNRRKEGGH
jgi:hypothetical protein